MASIGYDGRFVLPDWFSLQRLSEADIEMAQQESPAYVLKQRLKSDLIVPERILSKGVLVKVSFLERGSLPADFMV